MGVLSTTPRTWVASEIVTALELNTEVRDPLTTIQSAWTAYTPTVTGLTTTSGTLTARYQQVGKSIDFFIQFTLGASSAVAGATFTLPATAAYSQWNAWATGYDLSAVSTYSLTGIATTTADITVRVPGSPVVALGPAVPFTWATGDIITVEGRYEAA